MSPIDDLCENTHTHTNTHILRHVIAILYLYTDEHWFITCSLIRVHHSQIKINLRLWWKSTGIPCGRIVSTGEEKVHSDYKQSVAPSGLSPNISHSIIRQSLVIFPPNSLLYHSIHSHGIQCYINYSHCQTWMEKLIRQFNSDLLWGENLGNWILDTF